MTTIDVAKIKCAKCKVPIQAASHSTPDATISCPVCGVSDTLENAAREAADYTRQRTKEALNSAFRHLADHKQDPQFIPTANDNPAFRFMMHDE